MISLILYLCLVAVAVWLVFFILGQIPMPPAIRTIITVVVALVLLLWVFRVFGSALHA